MNLFQKTMAGVALGSVFAGAAIANDNTAKDGYQEQKSGNTAQSSQAAEEAIVEHYAGPDNPGLLMKKVKELSETQPVFLVRGAGWCPFCRKLLKQLDEISKTSSVSFRVINVDTIDANDDLVYPRIHKELRNAPAVPETYVYWQGKELEQFKLVGAYETLQELADYLNGIANHINQTPPNKPAPQKQANEIS